MRFKVQQRGDADSWYFEVDDAILHNGIAAGKVFKAKRLTAELQDAGEVEVNIHSDGRSIAIGNHVVPFASSGTLLKLNDARLKMGAPATYRRLTVETVKPIAPKKTQSNLGGGEQKSPLTGKVLSILVQESQLVSEGDVLLTIEAMKMENRILAECAGKIENIKVKSGDNVSVGDPLCFLKPLSDGNDK